ncbi:MAG TPA: serine/threonine-protein kinase, partial [Fimbriiglobus sp.]|nr:serine/threonine-protein kinase [Fimbriiglobus sp.]
AEPVDPRAEPPPDLTGRTLGDFRVLRKIGQGGMGQVYLARQLSLKRDVALKILSRELADSPQALTRFQAEAEAVARVTHANIVQVYAVGEQDGVRYMALEYVEGRDLRDHLARKGPPELPLALAVMRQVAAALLRASESGIVHRDIKPENILITRKAEVKVADFGLSRDFAAEGRPPNLTQTGMTLGTPLYMAPEQVRGDAVDHRTDLYSFGVTCYHLLAGHPPFRGATPFEVAIQHVQAEPEPLGSVRPDLPADLCAVVHKLMAKEPADRYQTARDVLRDLAKVQKGLPVGLPPVVLSSPAVPVAAAPAPSRWPARVAGLALVAVAAAVGWGAFALTHSRSPAGPVVGLPPARPPVPVVSARERELKARMDSRSAKPEDVFDAAVELGLLYVRERRLDDADKLFADLRPERPAGAKGRPARARLVGQLGQAVVLAHRDRADESAKLFVLLAARPNQRGLETFLFSHPAFGQAVADALDRDAENLHPAKLPAQLEWLRTPRGLAKGPR